jgi:CheY-like chemotaxis protein
MVVIDDDSDMRDSLVSLLQHWGHRVVQGVDADEALAAWRHARRPRLDGALVDLRLRGGTSGLDAIARLRQNVAPRAAGAGHHRRHRARAPGPTQRCGPALAAQARGADAPAQLAGQAGAAVALLIA